VKKGEGIIEVLKMTGFKTPGEFFEQTSIFDRIFFKKAIREHKKRQKNAWK